MKINILKRGTLVKNIRNGSIGVIVCEGEEAFSRSDNLSQFYKVLTDGEVVSWFKPNMTPVGSNDERHARDISKCLA
tara:strand:- start:290 stop:520 length:231 start_codon:yes stop_codon:yes gene_type:complete